MAANGGPGLEAWGLTASRERSLTPEAETTNDFLVALRAPTVQICEQPASLADHLEQAAARGIVVPRGPEVFREVFDALREERDLYLRAAGVLLVLTVRLHELVFLRLRERHPVSFRCSFGGSVTGRSFRRGPTGTEQMAPAARARAIARASLSTTRGYPGGAFA